MVFLELLATLFDLLEVLAIIPDLAIVVGKGVAWLVRGVLMLLDRGISWVAAWKMWP